MSARTCALGLVVTFCAVGTCVGAATAVNRLATQANPIDPAANVHHDPCYWLDIYSNADGTSARVEDDSTGQALTPDLRSDWAADSAKKAICRTRTRRQQR